MKIFKNMMTIVGIFCSGIYTMGFVEYGFDIYLCYGLGISIILAIVSRFLPTEKGGN